MKLDTATDFLAELEQVSHAFVKIQEDCGATVIAGASLAEQKAYEARQMVFERLQRLMEEWHGNVNLHDNNEVKDALKRELQKFLDGEKILEQHVNEASEQVRESLAELRRGKKGLSGYRAGTGRTLQPRFLSNRT